LQVFVTDSNYRRLVGDVAIPFVSPSYRTIETAQSSAPQIISTRPGMHFEQITVNDLEHVYSGLIILRTRRIIANVEAIHDYPVMRMSCCMSVL